MIETKYSLELKFLCQKIPRGTASESFKLAERGGEFNQGKISELDLTTKNTKVGLGICSGFRVFRV